MKKFFSSLILSMFSGALLISVLGLTGCGGTSSTYQLSGTVSYKGKPVPRGQITISPDPSNPGPGTVAEIKDGSFTTPPGKGHIGGKHILMINGFDGVPIPSGEGGTDPQGKELFRNYKMAVELPREDHTLEIKFSE